MSKKKVGVLRGGPSNEYDVSLKTGKSVIANLADRYEVLDVLISKDGIWHYLGVPIKPETLFKKVDVIFNALHGAYGEDGTIQKLLDTFKVPYTGSTALASAVGMNKILSKKVYKNNNLKTPIHTLVSKENKSPKAVIELFKSFPMPVVVKPSNSGSSIGTTIAKTISDLEQALTEALNYSDQVLIEEFISGKEATCGVVDNFRNESFYSLLPSEIKKSKDEIYDYQKKSLVDDPKVVCPGNFSLAEKKIIQEMAVNAHKALGLRHYSRSDFIINPKRGVYILETNTLPDLSDSSIFSQSLQAVGSSLPQFLDHLISLALEGK